MVTYTFVENVTASLVREYLSRKDCKNTLKMMDSELPRTEDSISNRSQLAREIHIEKIMRRNKEALEPFRSMLEVIVKFLMERAVSSKDSEGVPQQKSSTDLSRSDKKSSRPSSTRRKERHAGASLSKSETDIPSDIRVQEPSGLPQADVGLGSLQRERTTVITMRAKQPSVQALEEPVRDTDPYPVITSGISGISGISGAPKDEDFVKKSKKRPGSASRSRGVAGPISSSLDMNERRRNQKNAKSSIVPSLSTPSIAMSLGAASISSTEAPDLSPTKKETSSSSRSKLKNFGFDISPESTADSSAIPTKEKVVDGQEAGTANGPAPSRVTPAGKEGRSSRHRRSLEDEDLQKPLTSLAGSSVKKPGKKEVSTLGDLEMGDVDELEDELRDVQLGAYTPSSRKPIDCRPITSQLAMQLKTLLFGTGTGCFNSEWRLQGLGFNDITELSYGIVQHKGGPCGVLASIQACMLQRLLFAEGSSQLTAADLRQVSPKKRTDCLVHAICDVVWRAGQKRNAVIALLTPKAHFTGGGRYKADGLTETVNLNLFKSTDELREFVQANIRSFTESRGSGCILLLYSALFSRTIDAVLEDMDDAENKLVGAHGYCTQEMVNLILTGRAVSNVFNDVVELGSGREVTRLKGLAGRSDIGLLSLFEHYKSCQVGTYLKTPRFPIWVVCSESHFSVLFCLKKELIGDWRVERRFDLYYYDGLARQESEIRLTIGTTQPCEPSDADDLVPPLEHCIRTKWPEATVDWNGSEPLL